MKLLKNMDLLVVDDSDIICKSSRILLTKIGFNRDKIRLVGQANRAVLECRVTAFDILIVDYNLGEGSTGLQLLEKLYHEKLLAHDPIILIVTADNSATVIRSFSEFEPSGFIVKPLRVDVLTESLKACMDEKAFITRVVDSYHQAGLSEALPTLKEAKSKKIYNLALTKLCSEIISVGEDDIASRLLVNYIKANSYVRAHIMYVDLMLKAGNIEEAEKVLLPLRKANRFSVPVLELECRFQFEKGMYEQAAESMLHLHKMSPQRLPRLYALILQHVGFLANENIAKLIQELAFKSSHSIWEEPNLYFLLSWVLLQEDEFNHRSASEIWGMLTRNKKFTKPDNSLQSRLGVWSLANSGQYSAAYELLQSCEEVEECFETLFVAYHTLHVLGMWQEMQSTLQKLVAISDQEPQPLLRDIQNKMAKKLIADWRSQKSTLVTFPKSFDGLPIEYLFKLWGDYRFNIKVAEQIVSHDGYKQQEGIAGNKSLFKEVNLTIEQNKKLAEE